MGGEWRDRLLPWIAGSLLLLFAVVLAASQVDGVDCGEDSRDRGGETVLAAIAIIAAVLAGGAGVARVVRIVLAGRFDSRDRWILGAVLVAFAVCAVACSSAGVGLAIAGLLVTGIAFVVIVVAGLGGVRADSVGVLLPIYLFGAAYVYLAVAGIALIATSGIGC